MSLLREANLVESACFSCPQPFRAINEHVTEGAEDQEICRPSLPWGRGWLGEALSSAEARGERGLRPLHFLPLLPLLCCLACTAMAQTPAPANAEAYVKAFESSYRDVHSLRAGFTQTYTLGGRTREESGTVTFARGGLMRWDYQHPQQLFVSDGKEISFYVPEEHQLTRAPLKSSTDFRAPFELLLSRFNLHRVFSNVELAASALDHPPGDQVLRAFPKKEFAAEYTDVLIELDPQFNMRRLVVNYPDHGRMDFRFDQIDRNPPVSPSLFQFTPPAGTEIIDQH